MPFYGKRRYATKKATYRKRPFKKYGKSTGRKRFTKKTFTKNNSATATLRAQQIPNALNVKFNWDQTIAITTAGTAQAQINTHWVGNSFLPHPADQVTFVSAAGDIAPPLTSQWSNMYDRILIMGSSLKLQAQITTVNATAQVLECVLVAMPYNSLAGVSNLSAVVASFDALTFNDASSLPYAHRFDLVCNQANSKSGHFYKMFRKTKYMCQVRILKDDDNYYMNLVNSAAVIQQPVEGFVYCFKAQNSSNSAETLTIQARMGIYAMLDTRRNITQLAISA
nr:MAG: capsid protein [Cressdnaviricota sp.]